MRLAYWTALTGSICARLYLTSDWPVQKREAIVRGRLGVATLTPLRLCKVMGLVLVLAACGGPEAPPASPAVPVGGMQVRPSSLPLVLEYAAQLRGLREVEVRARVSGILLERRYQEGARVKAGDLLFRIDPAPFRAEAARARAEAGIQKANLLQATRERDRILQVYEQRLVSLRDRDNAIAAYESASAAFEASEAALRRAQLDLSYTDVRAPIAGLTSSEARSEGSLVTAGDDATSLLTHIVQADQLYVEFAMPQQEAEHLRAAMAANGSDVGVELTDAQGAPLGTQARVEFIAPSVGNDTGTVSVRATMDNKKGELLPGQVVRARLTGLNLPGSLVIPKRAVMHGMQGAFVWVIGEGEKAAQRPVKLGVSSGNNVAVLDGLKPNERVIVDGVLKVQPGALVKMTPITPDGAPVADEPIESASAQGAP
jgi:membrane fusion protein (multidrug efflux system)